MSILGFSLATMSSSLRGYVQRNEERLRTKVVDHDDPFFREIMRFVHSVMVTRNQEFRVFEDFFQGGERQKIYIRKFRDESEEEYYQRLDRSVVSNRCRRVVNKGAQGLYGVPPARRMEDDDAHERMMEVWRYNGIMRGRFHLDLARTAGTFGYQVIKNRYVRKDSMLPVTVRGGTSEQNEVEFIPLHPMLTIPIPRYGDQTKMGAIINLTMTNQLNPMVPNTETPELETVEFIDDTRWLKWRVIVPKGKNEVEGIREIVSFGPQFTDQNPYGDVNVPFTLYINPGDSPFVLDGASDLHDLVELQNKYNEILSDDGHVIENHTFPLLLLSGLTVDKDYKRGVADILSTKNSDAKGDYITWNANLDASSNYSDRMERNMREASGFSPVSDGVLDKIGQVRNLRGAMVPDMLTMREKQSFFGEWEQKHATACLEMIEWHEGTTYPNKNLNIQYSEDYIPVDELTRVESQAIALDKGMTDLKDIIKQRFPELDSDEEIEAKIDEIIDIMERLNAAKNNDGEGPTTASPERRAIHQTKKEGD